MSTIAIYSLKGGVGKTTLAVNLAWCAASLSARRTLLWDLDPQAASSYLLGDPAAKDHAQAVFSKDVEPARLIHKTGVDRLDLLPADASLRGLDLLFHQMDKKKRLQKLLTGLRKSYDRILLDCPPGLTDTSDQVMRAADLIVVPVIPMASLIESMTVRRAPVGTFAAKSPGGQAFAHLWQAIEKRLAR